MTLTKLSLLTALVILFSPKPAFADNIVSQTTGFTNILSVWQVMQELGDDLGGPIGSFTFRVSTQVPNDKQFDFTAQNTLVYDKDAGSIIVARGCASGDQENQLRGLTFNTQNVPEGFEDVSIDFSCNHYLFIPGHRYLILISNANVCTGCTQFAAAAYGPGGSYSSDLFTGGGLRYGNGNPFDYYHNSGSCNPVTYQWQDSTVYPTSGCEIWTSAQDDLYFALSDSPPPNPNAPQPPTPFLDLPWGYQSKGKTFSDAVLSINSYFDHEYPLESAGLSLSEPSSDNDTVVTFKGDRSGMEAYSSHDGYDYGSDAGANMGDPVLAAADGIATRGDPKKCGACGNYVLIDHGNGYQTRYFHMEDGSPIVQLGQSVEVKAGQMIGKVGATGNATGPHIHFMVVQDKNHDGNFDDNIPDGVTDPLGWQSDSPDPWPLYSFFYNGQQRTGNSSFYLYKQPLDSLKTTMTPAGGSYDSGKFKITFPPSLTDQDLYLQISPESIIDISSLLRSVGTTLKVTLSDNYGTPVTTLSQPMTIQVNLNQLNLDGFKPDTLTFYSSSDGVNWQPESTIFDTQSGTISTSVNHLTQFALVAERSDTTPPVTIASPSGHTVNPGWFSSDVTLTLTANDNSGSGVDYTLYKLDDQDWEVYTSPLTISTEGHHQLDFYSGDKDGNVEAVQTIEFDIDKTSPEAKIFINQEKSDIEVDGLDNNLAALTQRDNNLYLITDQAGNSLQLQVANFDQNKLDGFQIYSLQYGETPPQILGSNRYSALYQGTPDESTLREEDFTCRGETKVRITYDPQLNQSTIFTKEASGSSKVTQSGLAILTLTTNQGNLQYSY